MAATREATPTDFKGDVCRVADDKSGATPLWECPCRECWALECSTFDMFDDMGPAPTYAEWCSYFPVPGQG